MNSFRPYYLATHLSAFTAFPQTAPALPLPGTNHTTILTRSDGPLHHSRASLTPFFLIQHNKYPIYGPRVSNRRRHPLGLVRSYRQQCGEAIPETV